jgi:DNA helicase-2/ATP-dependent DNA helicase PcrA
MTNNSSEPERQPVLDAERAVNEQYLQEIERLLAEQPHLMKQISIVQSQQWTTSSLPRPGIDRGATAAVIGRVALNEDHPYSDTIGHTFYIAGWRVEKDGFETVNWAAPIASLYFEGRASEFPIASSVVGRRTFVLRLDDLVDYSDELESGVEDPFTGRARDFQIPTAPSRRRSTAAPTPEERPQPEPLLPGPETEEERPTEGPQPPKRGTPDHRLARLRAADAVVKVMQMPKHGRMGAVLPTMQPDQYQLVSAAADQAIVVQGQPGTGKTVIAAHRAVYLTSGERKAGRITRIAIVGPSDHYVEHVAPIISELKEPASEIRVLSLPALLRSICGLRAHPKAGPIGHTESSWALGRTIDDFVRSMPDRPRSGRMDQRLRRVVEALSQATEAEVSDNETLEWLRNLPGWNEISGQVRYLPMLATIAVALDPRAVGEWVGHLIVDEAQDVRPLEWRILTGSLLEPGGSLSLFGDMNQRRSDWTAASWSQLAEDLNVTDEDGHSEIHELGNGYRSTRQILRFANQLLPRGERGEQALRDGPQPTLTKVPLDGRTRASVDLGIDLTTRHSGIVALISTEPRPVSVEFRQRGWVRGRYQHSWTLDGSTVVILHPDEARGLEFDGAVVIEPGDFPENVGRHGVLYTSLTRANKELAVIHTKPLPRDLRPPR